MDLLHMARECLRPPVTFLFSCIVIFGQSSANAGNCIDIRPGYLYADCVRQKTKDFFDPKMAWNITELANGRYEFFSPPNSSSPNGRLHSEMYRIWRDGRSFLLKAILPGSPGFWNDDQFRRDLFGMLLGAELGGPEITRAGRFIGKDGGEGYYIEMEEIFRGIANSYTFKGLFTKKNQILSRLGFDFPTVSQLETVGQMLRINLEHGIYLGIDPDLIFSGNGVNVRWIDTTDWGAQSQIKYADWFSDGTTIDLLDVTRLDGFDGRSRIHNYAYFLTQFYRLNHRNGKVILAALRHEISQSKEWSDAQKAQLWQNLRISLVKDWSWPEADVDGGPANINNTNLLERCARFLSP